VGDDDADEHAFASSSPEKLLSIRVGTKGKSCTRYRLMRQPDIDRLLRVLLSFRSTDEAQGGRQASTIKLPYIKDRHVGDEQKANISGSASVSRLYRP